MRNKFIIIMLFITAALSLAVNAYAVPEANIYEQNNRVCVLGQMGEEHYNEEVFLMLFNADAENANKIGYIDKTKVKADGSYEFKFLFVPKNGTSFADYAVKVNQGGIDYSDTVLRAVVEGDKLYSTVLNLFNEGGEVVAVAKFDNYYNLNENQLFTENMKLMTGFYSDDNQLLGIDVIDTTKTDERKTIEVKDGAINILFSNSAPNGTAKARAFLWESFETVIPVANTDEVIIDQIITCWGDSLTFGAGGGSPLDVTGGVSVRFPNVLAELSGKDVRNYGIGGDDAVTIAARQGGVKMLLTEGIDIPSDTSKVAVKIESDIGLELDLLRPDDPTGSKGINPCYIGGIEGRLTKSTDSDGTVTYYFARTSEGEAASVAAGEVVTPQSMISRRKDIAVIFIGQNGGFPDSSPAGLISIINRMVDNMDEENKKFIVVGLTTGSASSRTNMENAMQLEYGAKYINMREYLSSMQAITDAGLEAALTEENKTDINNGKIPACLLADTVHLNSYGYRLLGEKVYERMVEIGILQ